MFGVALAWSFRVLLSGVLRGGAVAVDGQSLRFPTLQRLSHIMSMIVHYIIIFSPCESSLA